jgi:plastocyanin
MTKIQVAMAGLGCAALLFAGACGDDDDPGANRPEEGGDTVRYEIDSNTYEDLVAPAGGTIEITNSSGAEHTFTDDDDSFDVPVADGETAEVDAPEEAGDYPFHCEIHSSMAATLTVE